jgi:hypothetical protein
MSRLAETIMVFLAIAAVTVVILLLPEKIPTPDAPDPVATNTQERVQLRELSKMFFVWGFRIGRGDVSEEDALLVFDANIK